jgi:hypothetical protein
LLNGNAKCPGGFVLGIDSSWAWCEHVDFAFSKLYG